jgi:tRNA A37 N6-isopentenylltransferase MiaA
MTNLVLCPSYFLPTVISYRVDTMVGRGLIKEVREMHQSLLSSSPLFTGDGEDIALDQSDGRLGVTAAIGYKEMLPYVTKYPTCLPGEEGSELGRECSLTSEREQCMRDAIEKV